MGEPSTRSRNYFRDEIADDADRRTRRSKDIPWLTTDNSAPITSGTAQSDGTADCPASANRFDVGLAELNEDASRRGTDRTNGLASGFSNLAATHVARAVVLSSGSHRARLGRTDTSSAWLDRSVASASTTYSS